MRYCLAEYVTELNRRSERGFDPAVGATALPHEVRPPAGEFFVAYLHGEAVGCGAVKHHKDAPAEIKRMDSSEGARTRPGPPAIGEPRGVRAGRDSGPVRPADDSRAEPRITSGDPAMPPGGFEPPTPGLGNLCSIP